MKNYLSLAFVVTIGFIFLSCNDLPSNDGENLNLNSTNYFWADSTSPFILANGTKPDDWKMNSYNLVSVYINGDTLFTKMLFGGGCEIHEIKLVAWNYFLESYPVKAKLLISHDSHGDACKALITQVNKFDLSLLKYEYQTAYSSSSGIILLDILLSNGQSRTLQYTFWMIR